MSKEDDAFPIRNSCPFKPFQVDIDFPSESNHALNIGFLMLEITFSSYTNSMLHIWPFLSGSSKQFDYS